MDPQTHDFVGLGLCLALAAACYLIVWVTTRHGLDQRRLADRQVDAIRFHTPNLAVSPYDQHRPVDHATCEGPCGQRICRCHEADRSDLLVILCGVDDVAQGCGHGHSLCTDCAPGECDECLIDLRAQGVLSQYATGTWPTGGAS